MTEKLLTGTLSLNTTNQSNQHSQTLLKRSLRQNLLKRILRRTQKTKSTQVEQQRDQMIPLKLITDIVPLTRTTWRLRLLLAVLVEASLPEYLQLDTYSSNLITSLRQYNYYQ